MSDLLSEASRRTLFRVVRAAFPHAKFPDGPYQRSMDAVIAAADAERTRLIELMRRAGDDIPQPPTDADGPTREGIAAQGRWRLAVLEAQRRALLDARDHGTFDADVLAEALANIDASQLAIEVRTRPLDGG